MCVSFEFLMSRVWDFCDVCSLGVMYVISDEKVWPKCPSQAQFARMDEILGPNGLVLGSMGGPKWAWVPWCADVDPSGVCDMENEGVKYSVRKFGFLYICILS